MIINQINLQFPNLNLQLAVVKPVKILLMIVKHLWDRVLQSKVWPRRFLQAESRIRAVKKLLNCLSAMEQNKRVFSKRILLCNKWINQMWANTYNKRKLKLPSNQKSTLMSRNLLSIWINHRLWKPRLTNCSTNCLHITRVPSWTQTQPHKRLSNTLRMPHKLWCHRHKSLDKSVLRPLMEAVRVTLFAKCNLPRGTVVVHPKPLSKWQW